MERQAARWAGLADAVLAEAGRHGLHRSGRRRRCYDDGRVDAALLLPVVRGALPPDDPPSEATRKAVFGSCVATCRRPLCTRCSSKRRSP